MFPKKNRADKKAITEIFKAGKFVSSGNLSLKYLKKDGSSPILVGFVAPKTVSRLAVDRNLLRRRGYAALRKHINEIPQGFLGAFIFGPKGKKVFGGKRGANYFPIKNLENEIETILHKIH